MKLLLCHNHYQQAGGEDEVFAAESTLLESFGHQVVRLKLMTADGEILEIDRTDELFNAVVGGIGLLGIIVEATLQLI